jgi:DNA-binding transcriptional regulator YhcF (GntR family)
MDFDNNIPIYIQVINKIKQDLVTKKLSVGDKMPSTRDFAMEICLNLNTVARVYKELENEGVVFTKRGLGTFVTESEEKVCSIRYDMARELLLNFISGMKNIGYEDEEIINMLRESIKGGNHDKFIRN